MSGYLFAAHAREVLQAAQAASQRMRHPRVGTEHLLLAIAQNPGVRAASAFSMLGVATTALVSAIEDIVQIGTAPPGEDRPFAPRLLQVFDLAVSEASKDPSVTGLDTPHLLLGLLREGKGIGAQVLQDAGVTLDGARRALLPPPQA